MVHYSTPSTTLLLPKQKPAIPANEPVISAKAGIQYFDVKTHSSKNMLSATETSWLLQFFQPNFHSTGPIGYRINMPNSHTDVKVFLTPIPRLETPLSHMPHCKFKPAKTT
jgi:hypothetical protein